MWTSGVEVITGHQDMRAARPRIAGGQYNVADQLALDVHVPLLNSAQLEVRRLGIERSRKCSGGRRRWNGLKSAGETEASWGLLPSLVAQYEESQRRPPRRGEGIGLAQEGWVLPQALSTLAPGRVVEEGVAATQHCLVAAEYLPASADPRFEGCPVHVDARRPTHTILIGDEKLSSCGNVIGQAPVGFGDRSSHIPGQAKIERERGCDPPIVLDEGTPDCPAAAGDGPIERLVMNGQASKA